MNGVERKQDAGKGKWVAIVVLLAIGGALIGWYVTRDQSSTPGPANTSGLTPEQLVELEALKNRSIGHLENGEQSTEADADDKGEATKAVELSVEGFEKLKQSLPQEVLPYRNLAIAHLLGLRGNSPDEAAARDAIAELKRVAGDEGVTYFLEGRVLMQLAEASGSADDRRTAIAALEKAIELEPDNVAFHYALYDACKDSSEAGLQARARRAIGAAYAKRPDNLAIVRNQLEVQARAQDPAILSTLATAMGTFAPVMEGLAAKGYDLNQFRDMAEAGLQAENWPQVTRAITFLNNVVKPEEYAKADLRRVERHPLEYVLYQFSDAVREQLPPASSAKASSVEFVPTSQLPVVPAACRQVAVVDFDLDDVPDVVTLTDQRLQVWGREGDQWHEIASYPAEGMQGFHLADLDRDRAIVTNEDLSRKLPRAKRDRYADPDVLLWGEPGIQVLQNEVLDGGRQLKLIPQDEPIADLSHVRNAALVDFDHDGDLDVVAVTGNGLRCLICASPNALKFRDVTSLSQLPPADLTLNELRLVDWDRDVDVDLVAVTPSGQAAGYLENLRHGRLKWTEFDPALGGTVHGASLQVLESDGNVSWDLATAGQAGLRVTRTSTPQPLRVNLLDAQTLSKSPVQQVLVFDHDNDGIDDLLGLATGQVWLWRGQGDGTFAEQPRALTQAEGAGADAPASPAAITRLAVGDVDADGDLDVLAATDKGLIGWTNQGGNQHKWMNLYALGQEDNKDRSNHHAIGSLIEVKTGTRYQAKTVEQPWVHFGLGTAETADVVRILWTTGIPQAMVRPGSNVALTEPMDLKGSCPYIYTWREGQFHFFTDCLWAAPIGLQDANGNQAPSRPWEYLLIPGESLSAVEGHYRLLLTEELWEAAYFDHVELVVIDHPREVAVYSNEKVGPAELAEYKIHSVRQPRMPVSARDQQGRDVLEAISEQDGKYLKAFDYQSRQGLTEPHFLELDLGQLKSPKSVKLFLTGWIYPTDTSMNIAFSQDAEVNGPEMPSLWVPDADGQWQRVRPFIGFPGGKTKTIVIDLSDAFLAEDYRVRVATTAEIYWDQAFYTVDESAETLQVNTLPVASARLRYRGFSAKRPYQLHSPRQYDASRVDPTPQWPPMRGPFTRYGDVTDLLTQADDQMIVMGAGDAVQVEFKIPDALSSLPDGWQRDFFLHCVGWDKDADLNTLYGQTSDPLPFNAMRSYPYDPEHSYPDTPDHREYQRDYQNRQQRARAFWHWVRDYTAPVDP